MEQRGIACQMAIIVVDPLETIQIHVNQRALRFVPADKTDGAFQRTKEGAPIGKRSQSVGIGKLFQLHDFCAQSIYFGKQGRIFLHERTTPHGIRQS